MEMKSQIDNEFQPKYRNGVVISKVFVARPKGQLPIKAALVAYPGQRHYPDEEIRKNDRRIHLEMAQGDIRLSLAYKTDMQFDMWRAVFRVWVKPEKKAKYVEQLQVLIGKELAQAQLPIKKQSWENQAK